MKLDAHDSCTALSQLSNFCHAGHHGTSPLFPLHRDNANSQKAMSLPSSPHDYRDQTSETSRPPRYELNDELESTWNKILESSMSNNKPLLPYEEWNIDFSELTVGTRVGIGKFSDFPSKLFKSYDFRSAAQYRSYDLSMIDFLK